MEMARNGFALFGLACFILFILEWASPSPLKRLEGYQPKPRKPGSPKPPPPNLASGGVIPPRGTITLHISAKDPELFAKAMKENEQKIHDAMSGALAGAIRNRRPRF